MVSEAGSKSGPPLQYVQWARRALRVFVTDDIIKGGDMPRVNILEFSGKLGRAQSWAKDGTGISKGIKAILDHKGVGVYSFFRVSEAAEIPNFCAE